jgi:hypothetical protein
MKESIIGKMNGAENKAGHNNTARVFCDLCNDSNTTEKYLFILQG